MFGKPLEGRAAAANLPLSQIHSHHLFQVGESLHRVDSFFEHLVQLVGGVSESQVDFARLEWLIKEIEDEELKQVRPWPPSSLHLFDSQTL